MPQLLGGLAEDQRLSLSGIGLAAAAEALAMTVSVAVLNTIAHRLRLPIAAGGALLALAAFNGLCVVAQGNEAIIALRAMAGAAEGVILAIFLNIAARSVLAARWMSAMSFGMNITSLAAVWLVNSVIRPSFGVDGGFICVAVICLSGLVFMAMLPRGVTALPKSEGAFGLPAQGWAALLAMTLYLGAVMGFMIYLLPLATAAGLASETGSIALAMLLLGQILGSLVAFAIASRARHIWVILAAAICFLCIWPLYTTAPPAWMFVLIAGLTGFAAFASSPFLFALAAEVDPSRRSAAQCGSAQMLGVAAGPFLASFAFGSGGPGGLVAMGFALLIPAVTIVAILAFGLARQKPATAN